MGVLPTVSAAVDRVRCGSAHPARQGEMIGTRHHVPTDANGPMECHELMALSFASHLFQSLAQVPTYSAWLVADADLTSALAYERRVPAAGLG